MKEMVHMCCVKAVILYRVQWVYSLSPSVSVSVGTTAGVVKSTRALDRIQSAYISFGFVVTGVTAWELYNRYGHAHLGV